MHTKSQQQQAGRPQLKSYASPDMHTQNAHVHMRAQNAPCMLKMQNMWRQEMVKMKNIMKRGRTHRLPSLFKLLVGTSNKQFGQ